MQPRAGEFGGRLGTVSRPQRGDAFWRNADGEIRLAAILLDPGAGQPVVALSLGRVDAANADRSGPKAKSRSEDAGNRLAAGVAGDRPRFVLRKLRQLFPDHMVA